MTAPAEIHTIVAAGDGRGVLFGCVVTAYVQDRKVRARIAGFGAGRSVGPSEPMMTLGAANDA